MIMTDPISDMLTRIRNAQKVKKTEVILPYSKIKFNLAKILEKQGFIKEVEQMKNTFDEIRLGLKYNQLNQPVVKFIKRVSKPGRRVYVNKDDLPIVLDGLGIAIISTSKGLMTNKEAKKQRLGGEVICEIY